MRRASTESENSLKRFKRTQPVHRLAIVLGPQYPTSEHGRKKFRFYARLGR